MNKKTTVKRGLLFILCCFFLAIQWMGAQSKVIENDKGERIIVFEDGSTQDYNLFEPDNSESDNGKKQKENSTGERRYPIFNDKISPNEYYVSVTEADLARIAERRAQLSQEAALIAHKRAEEAKKNRLELERVLNNISSEADNRKHMQLQLAAAKKLEVETKNEANQANILAEQDKMFARGGNLIETFLASQEDSKVEKTADPRLNRLSVATSTKFNLPFGENYTGQFASENTSIYPPGNRCRIAFEGIDESTKKLRKDIQKQLLFTYTDERLRVYLKDKPYLKCDGFLTNVGGFKFLTLEFTFAYPNADEAYGFIEKGSVLTVKMLNGKFVNLRSGVMDEGRYDLEKELLTYRVHYQIDRNQWSILSKNEMDTILVFWSSGYEEYEVFNMDFFINQIRCLEN